MSGFALLPASSLALVSDFIFQLISIPIFSETIIKLDPTGPPIFFFVIKVRVMIPSMFEHMARK